MPSTTYFSITTITIYKLVLSILVLLPNSKPIVSDLVNRGTSTSRGTRKPMQLVVYKRGSKAKEKERGGQAAPLEVIYDLRVT